MGISEDIAKAKEIGTWVQNKTFNMHVPSDDRTRIAVALLQHALDITDAIILLIEKNVPSPAFSLFRPLHEVYTRGVWLLGHASEEDVEKFKNGRYPGFNDMIKGIGDNPETGGEFIKRMSNLNLKDFHGLTHGGMEHVLRRLNASAIEPNYPVEEVQKLIRVRNQYSSLIACFLLQLTRDENGLIELLEKRNEWRDAL